MGNVPPTKPNTWDRVEIARSAAFGRRTALPLTAIGAELALAEIYEGLAFEPE